MSVPEDEALFLVARYLQGRGLESVSALVRELEERGTWTVPTWDGGQRSLSLEQYAGRHALPGVGLATLETLLSAVNQHPMRAGPPRSLLQPLVHLVAPPTAVAMVPATIALMDATQLGLGPRRQCQRRVMEEVQLSAARLRLTMDSRGHTHNVFNLALHPDGEVFASGADDGLVKIWARGSGRLRYTLRGFSGVVVDLQYSPDGRFLATAAPGARDGVMVYEHPSYRQVAWLTLPDGVLAVSLAFFRDEHRTTLLAVMASNRTVRVCRAEPYWEWISTAEFGMNLQAMSAFGNRLAVGMESTFQTAEFVEGKLVPGPVQEELEGPVPTVEWSPDGAWLFVAPITGEPLVCDVARNARVPMLSELLFRGSVMDARFSVHGRFLFVLSGREGRHLTVSVVEMATQRLARVMKVHDSQCFVLSPHPVLEHIFLSCGYDGRVQVLNALTCETIQVFQVGGEVMAGAWTSDGTAIVVATALGRVMYLSGDAEPSQRLPHQFFASDYDPVTVNEQLQLIDAQSGLPLMEHAAMGQVMVNFDGSPHGSVSGLPLEGHVSAQQRMGQLHGPDDNVAAALLMAGGGDVLLGGAHNRALGAAEPNAQDGEDGDDSLEGQSSSSSSFLDEEDDEDFGDEGRGSAEVPVRRSRRRAGSRLGAVAGLSDNELDDDEHVVPRRSTRQRSHNAEDDMEADLDFLDDGEGGERVRRSLRKTSSRVLADLDSDDEEQVEAGDMLVVLPPTPPWMVAETQPRELTWFMPQPGDRVFVFFEGLEQYFDAFCPDAVRPSGETLQGEWSVTQCAYARHAQGDTFCQVGLVSVANGRALSLPFHTCLGLTDYIVPSALVLRPLSLAIGSRVQAFFADSAEWFPGSVLQLRPEGWSSVGVSWDTDEEGADVSWLHPWELFPFDDARTLGAIDALFVASPEQQAEQKRVFGCLLDGMRDMLQFSCFKSAQELHSLARLRHQVLCPMSFTLLLNRLRNGFYRSVEAVQVDFASLVASIEALPKKSRRLPAVECYGRLDACFRDPSLRSRDEAEAERLWTSGGVLFPEAAKEDKAAPMPDARDDAEFEMEGEDEEEEEEEDIVAKADAEKKKKTPRPFATRSEKKRRSGERVRSEVDELLAESEKARTRAKRNGKDKEEEDDEEFGETQRRPKRAAAAKALVSYVEGVDEEEPAEKDDDFEEDDEEEDVPQQGNRKRRSARLRSTDAPEEEPSAVRRSSRRTVRIKLAQ